MIRTALLKRFCRLSPEERRALASALVALAAASAAVAFLPFRRAIGFGSVPLARRVRATADRSVWAVEAVARRLPWRAVCIHKGIAVQRILRSGGVDAVLHYGARRDGEKGELEAHVWVSVGGKIVIGAEESVGLAELATFPPPAGIS